jgi:hypothetical protein
VSGGARLAVAVVCAAAALAGAGCGDSGSTASAPPVTSGGSPTHAVKAALEARLASAHLNYRWVACVRNGRAYQNAPVVRCNVNFGDPHIEAYCSVLIGGKLRTNHEDTAIPCREDRAGDTSSTVSSHS